MQLDLNLLRALDVLLEECSVGEAAFRLNLSEPAMSRTLGRIRKATGDQILVRTGHKMIPTPYAERIRDEVHRLVRQAQTLLNPEHGLDLSTLDRTFTLQSHDAVLCAIGPSLVGRIEMLAPGVRLRFLTENSTDTQDLRKGQVDFELGSSRPEQPEFGFEVLGEDHLQVVLRPDHRLASGDLTPELYAAARHITVSRRGRLRDPMDQLLENVGLQRRVVTTVPSSTAALQFIWQSDVVAVVPKNMCQDMIQRLGLVTRPLPLPAEPIPVVLTWHQRMNGDPAHEWLRSMLRDSVQEALKIEP